MVVYRICRNEEVYYILNNNDFSIVGSFSKGYTGNTHKYQLGHNYMHFFQNIDDIFYMKTNKGRCICIYDIPDVILEKYSGVGIYPDYVLFRYKKHIIEYAVDTKEMKVEYLKKVDILLDDIDYDCMLDGIIDNSLVENIYDASKPVIRTRKKEETSS